MEKLVILIFILFMATCDNESNNIIKSETWHIKEIGGISEFETRPFIEFDIDESRITGNSGCNNFFGELSIDKDKISFENVGATRMACPDMSTEDLLFKALDEISSYEIVDEELHLYSSDGSIVIKLEQLLKQSN